jgi:ubiquinone/menaquinone biosynthesis C-methylase UbiE
MNTEKLSHSKIGRMFIRTMGSVLESRLRYKFFGPKKILQGAEIQPGQNVLEVGCGSGFFTITAAQMIGEQGCLVAMDPLPLSVETVSRKVQSANLKNTRVIKGDALDTQLENESMDTIFIFGVIPSPMLPMDKLLAEMHRILKPGGMMAIWPPSWILKSITRTGLFTIYSKRNNVSNYKRC